MSSKLASGAAVPELTVSRAGGGDIRIGGPRDDWQLVVVYRSRHCPVSKKYLERLDGLFDEFAERGIEVVVVSADDRDQAEADAKEYGWRFALGYDLSIDMMRTLGVYISEPRPQETDRPFAEPALFAIAPDGIAQIIEISNAPFALPDLDGLLTGLTFIQNRNYPPRGTMA